MAWNMPSINVQLVGLTVPEGNIESIKIGCMNTINMLQAAVAKPKNRNTVNSSVHPFAGNKRQSVFNISMPPAAIPIHLHPA
jgi:hypothetical protein